MNTYLTLKVAVKKTIHATSSAYSALNSNVCPEYVCDNLQWRLVLQSGSKISRHLSMLANKAQLGSDFPFKRVPTILTIERREKRKKKERLAGRGLPSPPLPVALGQRTGAVSRADQIFPLSLLNGFLDVCLEQEPDDKVHRRKASQWKVSKENTKFCSVRAFLPCY